MFTLIFDSLSNVYSLQDQFTYFWETEQHV